MSLITSIIIGFIVGAFARFLMPGRYPLGCLMTILLGIGGALVGKFVGQALGVYAPEQQAGFLMSLVGAVLILMGYNYFKKNKPEIRR